KIEKPMHIVEGLARATQISNLRSEVLEKLATDLGTNGAGVLEGAKKQKDIGDTNKKIAKADAQIKESETDLARWRENLKAAGGDKGGAPASLVARVMQLE